MNVAFPTLFSVYVCNINVYNKYKFYIIFISTEKEYLEQLAELTRLLYKLSEVRNIFSKAQIEYFFSPEDPTKALVLFFEVFFTY